MDQDRQSARENFRQLSGKEKFQHIVRYYGLAALGIVIVIIILIDLIGRHTLNTRFIHSIMDIRLRKWKRKLR